MKSIFLTMLFRRGGTRECYTQLYQVNEEMLRNHKLYCSNHEELLSVLRKFNQIIQQVSRLRGEFLNNCNLLLQLA